MNDVTAAHYKEMIRGLHEKWTPHAGQQKAGIALFREDIRSIFLQCPRKWGKTEFSAYVLWRWAMSYPGSNCYYIAPLLTQAREIIWSDPRLQSFGPREWLMDGSLGINNTEMRLRFKNGSFIKVDGSDNFEKHRGTRPHIITYEEFKDHRKEFRDIMRPNLSVFNAPEIFIGTPPEDVGDEANSEFLKTAYEHQTDPTKFFYHGSPYENPAIPKEWLDKEKARLYARGEGDVWEREYEAKYVKGGAKKIFPMLKHSIVRMHGELVNEISRDIKKLEWFCVADPAGATCFAVLFAAINPYTKKIYILDEIYEQNQSEMTVKKIGQRIRQIRQELNPRTEWRNIYDEAETWFSNEMMECYGEYFEPTRKSLDDKLEGLSLIKDILLADKLAISARCTKLYWEMDKYQKDKSGKIPKKDDHALDCVRYILGASYYSLNNVVEYKESEDENFRGARISDDFPNLNDDGSFRDNELERLG